MGKLQQILNDDDRIGASRVHVGQVFERGSDIAGENRIEQVEHTPAIGKTKHLSDQCFIDFLTTVSNRLIEQRQSIACGTLGRAGNQPKRSRFRRHLLFGGNLTEEREHRVAIEPA